MKKFLLGSLLVVSTFTQAQITNGLVEEFRFDGTGLSESGNVDFTSLTTFGTDRYGTSNSTAAMHASFYTTIPNLPAASEDRTISIWIYPTSVNSDNIIFCYGGFSGNAVYGGSFSQTQLYNFTYSANLPYFTSNVIDTWKHVAYTYEGGTLARIYVDGALVSSGPLSVNTGTAAPFYLGTLTGGSTSGAFNGYFDDLAIYDRALSAAEISSLYNECRMNTTITQSGTTLTTNAVTNGTYQWIDCNNANAPIAGANAQTFTPSVSGSYAVIITNDSCADTSACQAVTISTSGIEEQTASNFNIYPNPAQDFVTLNNLTIGSTLQLTDMTGKTVLETSVSTEEMTIDLNGLMEGVYFVQILDNASIIGTKKLVISK
jgi:hypothetical protein